VLAYRGEVLSDDLGLGVVGAQHPHAVGQGLLVHRDGPAQVPFSLSAVRPLSHSFDLNFCHQGYRNELLNVRTGAGSCFRGYLYLDLVPDSTRQKHDEEQYYERKCYIVENRHRFSSRSYRFLT